MKLNFSFFIYFQRALIDERPQSFEDCVKWARLHFEENYCNQIKQLLFNFPRDQQTSGGQPFWSGPKRCPDPITFDINDELHLEYIVSGANLKAEIYKIPQIRDREAISAMVQQIEVRNLFIL